MSLGPIDRRRCSVTEAAPVLGVSVYMVRALIRQRRLAYHRIGRRIILDRQDLEQFLRAHRVEPRELRTEPPRRLRPASPSRRDPSGPRADERGPAPDRVGGPEDV
ncbi:MAG TPA: helix-turn-helix domain-containing protein [Methylomirabilota bacterium]|nr:helix-turn-helix domain-containing protein [Methylomirabilota bacterium]